MPTLPPELFPHIASVLARSYARKTLANLLLADKSTYDLCIPSFMRFISLIDFKDAPEKLGAFLVDSQGTGKFAHVKELLVNGSLDYSKYWDQILALWNAVKARSFSCSVIKRMPRVVVRTRRN